MYEIDTPKQGNLQHQRNQPPPPRFHLRDLSNHTMDAMISTFSNANPSTAFDVRSWPISSNSGRCSERHTGSHSKNREKMTPLKPIREPKNRSLVRNFSFIQHVKVCKNEATYMVAMRALCDGRDNNPMIQIKKLYMISYHVIR